MWGVLPACVEDFLISFTSVAWQHELRERKQPQDQTMSAHNHIVNGWAHTDNMSTSMFWPLLHSFENENKHRVCGQG